MSGQEPRKPVSPAERTAAARARVAADRKRWANTPAHIRAWAGQDAEGCEADRGRGPAPGQDEDACRCGFPRDVAVEHLPDGCRYTTPPPKRTGAAVEALAQVLYAAARYDEPGAILAALDRGAVPGYGRTEDVAG